MSVHPDELPLIEREVRCVSCTHHEDTAHPTQEPATEFVPRGQSAVYEGAGVVKGPHFQRRCRYCGFRWPEAKV